MTEIRIDVIDPSGKIVDTDYASGNTRKVARSAVASVKRQLQAMNPACSVRVAS